jgi:hypothetical protein
VTSAPERLTAALEQLRAQLAAIQRRRSRIEAPPQLTDAYAGFLFGIGFARLGRRERAKELAGEAAAALEAVSADEVHAFLTAAFSARSDQAIARRPRYAPLPEPLVKRLNELSRVARYKVDRLREALPTLETDPVIDAIGGFSRRESPPLVPPPELVALLAIDEPAARVARIQEHVVRTAAIAPDARAPLLAACFDAMLELTEEQVIPLLVQAMPLLEGLPPELYARALTVAARFGWGELVPELVAPLRTRLASASAGVLHQVLGPCLRALRGLGLRDEVAGVLAELAALVGVERHEAAVEAARGVGHQVADEYRGPRLMRAGGLVYIGDPRGPELLGEALALIEKTTHPTQRLDLIRDLTSGYAHASIDFSLERIPKLVPYFERTTDTYGTNSHYCLSVLHFIDSLVHAITGLADDNPREAGAPAR